MLVWVGAIAFTVGLFLIGMLAIIMAPQATAQMSRLGRARPISSLALGLVTILCVPIRVKKERRVVPVGESESVSRQEPTFHSD